MEKQIKTDETAAGLLSFIQESPSCFHVIQNCANALVQAGFTQLPENESWDIAEGGRYFVTRNSSSIIAFMVPSKKFEGFAITASHSDSPSFKIKEHAEIRSLKRYIKLNVEKYGGMLCAPWFDRPLSVAGRVICREKSAEQIVLTQRLVNVDRDLLMIPNLAIHLHRDVNDGSRYNVQNDMLPVLSCGADDGAFNRIIADAAGVSESDVLGADLFLYNRMKGTFWGADNEFIASTKLDDLACAWTSFRAFTDTVTSQTVCEKKVPVFCVFDNEEVGSQTRQGAASTFLHDVLVRLNECCGRSSESYLTALAGSFLVSADNAHAAHPNFEHTSDPVNRPVMNGGPVIKFNAAQRYTSDAVSASLFKLICENAQVPYQLFTNRSDIPGGSTLGNISGTKVSVPSVDIGLAQWAMHSPYESAGAQDVALMVRAVREFYRTDWKLPVR